MQMWNDSHGGGMRMSSIQDVARLAGVSKTLVSRVINGQTGVSEKSREKILQAMRELQYRPNGIARSLVLKRTNTIGVALDSLCEPYFFELIEGIEQVVAQTDYDVVFCSGRNSKKLKNRSIQYFAQGRTDGVIIYGSKLDDEEIILQLQKSGFPFVVVENDLANLQINNIVVDNEFGAGQAVDHLIACGCRSIIHMSGNRDVRAALDRQNGFIVAMQRRGFTIHSDMLVRADFSIEGSYEATRDFFHRCPAAERPDGIFCSSDKTAYGTILALQEMGIRVPEDVMIVGFDDDRPPMLEVRLPKLTTLSQPLRDMGSAAVRLLLEELEGESAHKRRLVFYPQLIVRETTRPR